MAAAGRSPAAGREPGGWSQQIRLGRRHDPQREQTHVRHPLVHGEPSGLLDGASVAQKAVDVEVAESDAPPHAVLDPDHGGEAAHADEGHQHFREVGQELSPIQEGHDLGRVEQRHVAPAGLLQREAFLLQVRTDPAQKHREEERRGYLQDGLRIVQETARQLGVLKHALQDLEVVAQDTDHARSVLGLGYQRLHQIEEVAVAEDETETLHGPMPSRPERIYQRARGATNPRRTRGLFSPTEWTYDRGKRSSRRQPCWKKTSSAAGRSGSRS